ncbi:MAG: hypothetical protein ACI9IV_001708 [Paracoccaceae bacterium]
MRVGGFGHFAQALIKTFGKQDVQKPNTVLAGCACAQMAKCIREAGDFVHVQQYIGSPHIWKTPVEIKDKPIGLRWNGGGQAVNFQDTILNGAAWNGTRFLRFEMTEPF